MLSKASLGLSDWRSQNAVVCVAMQIVSAISSGFAGTALVRLLESDVCRNYYIRNDSSFIASDGSVAEMKCKKAAIQASLSGLLSIGTVTATAPGTH